MVARQMALAIAAGVKPRNNSLLRTDRLESSLEARAVRKTSAAPPLSLDLSVTSSSLITLLLNRSSSSQGIRRPRIHLTCSTHSFVLMP